MVYHTILNIVSCAIQQDFVVYPLYRHCVTSANLILPRHPSTNPQFLGNHNSALYVPESVSVLSIGLFVSDST